MVFLAERIHVGIWKGQTLKMEREHSILLHYVPIDTKGGYELVPDRFECILHFFVVSE